MTQPPPITAEELVGWFAECIRERPKPTAWHVGPLEKHIQRYWEKGPKPQPDSWTASRTALRQTGLHLKKGLVLLKQAAASIGALGPVAQQREIALVTDTTLAIERFLEAHPPRERGERASMKLWHLVAASLAPRVRSVLLRAKWPDVGMSSNDGPVPYVVSKILFRMFDVRVDRQTVARHLRSTQRLRVTPS